jgi:plasmid maintenance system killer protein
MILNEKRPISLTCVQTILQSFRDVDARWLATGDGSMSRSFEQTLLRKLDLLRQAMRYRSVMTTQQRDVFDSLAGNEELEGFINANIDVWIRRYVAPHGGVSFLDK